MSAAVVSALAVGVSIFNTWWVDQRTESSDAFEAAELLQKAWVELRERDVEAAKHFVELAELKDATNPKAPYMRGFFESLRGAHLQAVPHFNTALELAPGYERAMIQLADSLREVRRFDEAERLLIRAERLLEDRHPQDVLMLSTLYLSQGHLRKAQRRPDDAHELYRKACSEDATNPEARFAYARSLWDRGDAWLALEQYQLLIQVDPERAAYWSAVGQIFLATRRWAAAEQAFRRSVELTPRTGEYQYLALALGAQGRVAESDAALAQSWAVRPLYALDSPP